MKKASVDELYHALDMALAGHAMQRSLELRSTAGEPTMRVITRHNKKWTAYSIEVLPEVNIPEELIDMVYGGKYFEEVEYTYSSFLAKMVHIKPTNTAGVFWAFQHLAFDGLSLFSSMEDLYAALNALKITPKPHVPYKLWADAYFLYRNSHAAQSSIQAQVRRSGISQEKDPNVCRQATTFLNARHH